MPAGSELPRKLIHMAVGLGAFGVAFLGPFYSALALFALSLFNILALPHIGGRMLWRDDEARRGAAIGIVLYPLVLLFLVLVFWRRLEVVAAVWALLAFGDGMATIVGTAWGTARLPWNPRKSWAGTLAFWLFGTLGSAAALWWALAHQGRGVAPGFLVAACSLTALIGALIESHPQGLDDNLSMPLLAAALLFGVLQTEGYWPAADLVHLLTTAGSGAAITLALGGVAYLARSIDLSGLVAGVLIGTVIYTFLGGGGLLPLAAFVALGSGATLLGYRHKARQGLAQEAGGRRSARHAIANAGVAAVLAVFAATTPFAGIYLPAFVAAFAAAAGDTVSSEVGQLWSRRTRLITTWRPVPRGTDGGVSLIGTLAGLAASAAIAVLGWEVGFYPPVVIVVVVLAAFVGTTADSLAGATLERRGLLDNEAVNVLNTLVAALAAAGLILFLV